MNESIWKKEIRLRKPKHPKAEVAAPVVPAATAPEPSVWKKELHLRKQPEPLPPFPTHLLEQKREEAPPAAPDDIAPATSIWKRELHLRKQPEPLPPFPTHLLEQKRTPQAEPARQERDERPRGTVIVPVVPERPEPLQRVERWTARVPAPHTEFPRPAAGEEQDPVALLPREDAAVDPAPVLPPLPTPTATYGWTPPEEPTEPEAVTVHEPEAAAPPTPLFDLEPAADTEVSDTQLAEPEAVSSREPEAVAARVPSLSEAFSAFAAAQRPTGDDLEEEASAEEAPARVEAPPVEPLETPEEPVAVEPVAEKVPLLKREIHLGRKPKANKAPAAPKAKKEKKQKAASGSNQKKSEPKQKKPPLLKRELNLPKRGSSREKAESGHKISRVVGLRIGSSQLAAAHVRNNGSHEVLQLARIDLERGLVVAGEIREPVALAKALKSFFATNKLPRKDIRLGVASNRIGVRVLDVPAVGDHKQFENAIRFRAQETLPISVADAVLDHVVIGERANDEGDAVRRVLLVFAHKELVSRYVDVCRQAGLRLAGIDLDAFALLRAVGAQSDDGSPRACVAVALGHERTVFAVSDGSVCDFTRVLEWGGSALDIAIARALNITPSQAEPVKRALDLDSDEAPAGLSPMEFEAARAAAKAEIGQLVRELASSLRFYQSREDSLDIGEIVLAGGGAQMPGLAAEVQRGLGAPVRVADPFAQVSLPRKLQIPDETGSLAIAVGLGIEA